MDMNHRDPSRVSRGQLGQPSPTAARSDLGLSNIQLRSTPGPSVTPAVPSDEQHQHPHMPPSVDRGGVEPGRPSGLSDGITSRLQRNLDLLDQLSESSEILDDDRDNLLVANPRIDLFSLNRYMMSYTTPGQTANSNGSMAAESVMPSPGFPLDSHAGDRGSFANGVAKDNESADGSSSSDGRSSDSEDISSSDDDDDDDGEPPKKKLNMCVEEQQAMHFVGPSPQGLSADVAQAGGSGAAAGAFGGGNAFVAGNALDTDELLFERRERILTLAPSIHELMRNDGPGGEVVAGPEVRGLENLRCASTRTEVIRAARSMEQEGFLSAVKAYLDVHFSGNESDDRLEVYKTLREGYDELKGLLVYLAGCLDVVIKLEPLDPDYD